MMGFRNILEILLLMVVLNSFCVYLAQTLGVDHYTEMEGLYYLLRKN